MKVKVFVLIFFLIFIISAAYAQGQEKRIVLEVKVINNKVVSEQSILSKLQTKPQVEYSPVVLSDDIKRLYATGLFSDASADIEECKEGVTVIFNVKEKPVIEEIVFSGNRKIRKKKLLSEMKIKKNEIFDQVKLKEDMEMLKKFYAKKGYALANIEYTLEEKGSKVGIKITIDEGNLVKIRKINFEGNNAFKNKRLLKLIKTKSKGWANSGFFKEDVLEEDIDRITSFYQEEGYIDVKVNSRMDYNQKKNQMYLIFVLEEGKQYKVGKVNLTGNLVFPQEHLKGKFELIEDAIYSENKLRTDVSKIQSDYFDQGYISSTVKADTVLNSQTGRVDVSYNITEGSIAYVDKINVRGNTRTKDEIIRREMRLFPGDRYNGEKLKRSRQRLYNLGYFEEVSFDTAQNPTSLPDKYDMDIFVKESKTGEFSFGAGYSSVDKFIGFVDLTQNNFDLLNFPTFTGAGQKLRIRMEFGSERKDYELGFVEPWFLGYPVTVGFNIYTSTRDWDKYDEKRVGGNVFVGKELNEYWHGKLTHRYESIRIANISIDASQSIFEEEGKNYISSIITEISHDTRDNIYNPTTGMYNLFFVEYAGGMFGGDKNFVKYETVNNFDFPVSNKAVFELSGRVGLADAFSDSEYVPVFERFYAGGANSIRGYKERRVGPEGERGDPIGGQIRMIFNAEYTYKISNTLKWAFFYDNGNVWANRDSFNWDNLKLKSSIGSGIRIKTPLGPIRIDYGYALNPKEGDSRGRIHFSMSHEF